ncbi:hypothetical protein [Sphingomonas sp. LR55]|uniref:hypothetical protein n=1 Tax=Sphingomonas sp. LR55 TaxID=3050231 RepID=UPI003FA6BF0A
MWTAAGKVWRREAVGGVRSSVRIAARAAAPIGSARRISGIDARACADDLEKAEAVHRGALERLRQ